MKDNENAIVSYFYYYLENWKFSHWLCVEGQSCKRHLNAIATKFEGHKWYSWCQYTQ